MRLYQRIVVAGLLTTALITFPARAGKETAGQSQTHGYGLLHELLSDLRDTDKILYVKLEAKPVETFVSRLASTADRLATGLKALADGDDTLRIDETGLPEVERRSREAIRESQFSRMAPLVGESGTAFERTLLLGHLKAVDQLRHMTGVMLESESHEDRREFLEDAKLQFERLFSDVNDLLERRYFCADGS